MRMFIVGLLCALSYAQTERSSRLRNMRLLPLGVPDEMSRDDLTQMVAAGLDMNKLQFPETRISEEDAWMYQPGAIRLARTRAPNANLGEYPLGNDKSESRMWDWLKKNDYVVGGTSRLLSKPRAQQAQRQYFPDLEYEELMPLISQWSGNTNAFMPYAMGEESFPYWYANVVNNAATGNTSISQPTNTGSGLPAWAYTDAEEYLPYINQGAAASTNQARMNPQASMITMKWGGEDWRQYNAYLMGMAIDGVDTGELAQYQQVAAMTGHNINSLPKTPGMFSFGGITNGYGGFSALQNGGASGLPSTSTAAFQNIPDKPINQAKSYMPMMFMEPEDQQQYMQYKQGIYSSNLDQSEIMKYDQYNRMSGGQPVQWRNGPFAGRSTGFAPTMLSKTHQMGQTNPTHRVADGEEAVPYLIQQNAQQQMQATNQQVGAEGGVSSGGSQQQQQNNGLSPAMMAMMMMSDSFGEGGMADPMMSMLPGVVNGYMNGGVGGASMAAMAAMSLGEGDISPMMMQNMISGLKGNNRAKAMGMAAMAMMSDNEEMIPMIMGMMGGQGGGMMGGGNAGRGMMPAMVFDGEDMQQYINYIHGIRSEGMDQSEIQRYAGMARQQGIRIPGMGGMGGMGMGSGAATSGNSGSNVPNYAGGMGAGMNPTMMLDNEKMRDYNMYINGILTSNMDASEIAMYQQIARASGITPKSYSYMPNGMSGGMKLQKAEEPVLQAAQKKPHHTNHNKKPYQDMSDMMEDLREGVKNAGNMDGDAYINAMRMGMDPKKIPMPKEGLDMEQMQQLYYIQQQQKNGNDTSSKNAPSMPLPAMKQKEPEFEAPEMEDVMNLGAMSNFFNNMKNNAPKNPFGFPMPQFPRPPMPPMRPPMPPMRPPMNPYFAGMRMPEMPDFSDAMKGMKMPEVPEMEDVINYKRWNQMTGGNSPAPPAPKGGDTGVESNSQATPGHWSWVWVPNQH